MIRIKNYNADTLDSLPENVQTGLNIISSYQHAVKTKQQDLSNQIVMALEDESTGEISEGNSAELIEKINSKAQHHIDFYTEFNSLYNEYLQQHPTEISFPIKYNKQSLYLDLVKQCSSFTIPFMLFGYEPNEIADNVLSKAFTKEQMSTKYLPWVAGTDTIRNTFGQVESIDCSALTDWNYWGTPCVGIWHITQKLVLEELTGGSQYNIDINDPTQHNHFIPNDVADKLAAYASPFITRIGGKNIWTGDSGGGYVFGGTGGYNQSENTSKESRLCATDCSEFVNLINNYSTPRGIARLSTGCLDNAVEKTSLNQYEEVSSEHKIALSGNSMFRPEIAEPTYVTTIESSRDVSEQPNKFSPDGMALNVRCLTKTHNDKPLFTIRKDSSHNGFFDRNTIMPGDTIGWRGHVFNIVNVLGN